MERYEKIVVLDNEVQAQLVDSVLSERGIPHMMMSYRDAAYDGIFQGQKGWGHIEAPQHYKQEIIDILEDIKRQSSSSLSELGDV